MTRSLRSNSHSSQPMKKQKQVQLQEESTNVIDLTKLEEDVLVKTETGTIKKEKVAPELSNIKTEMFGRRHVIDMTNEEQFRTLMPAKVTGNEEAAKLVEKKSQVIDLTSEVDEKTVPAKVEEAAKVTFDLKPRALKGKEVATSKKEISGRRKVIDLTSDDDESEMFPTFIKKEKGAPAKETRNEEAAKVKYEQKRRNVKGKEVATSSIVSSNMCRETVERSTKEDDDMNSQKGDTAANASAVSTRIITERNQNVPIQPRTLTEIDLNVMGDFALDRAGQQFEFATASASRLKAHMMDPDTNLERPFRVAGIVTLSQLTKEGTCANELELSPLAALPSLELDLNAPIPKYFDLCNQETVSNTRGMQAMDTLADHINEGRRSLFESVDAAPPVYRVPISDFRTVRLTGDSIFVGGNGNYGSNPTPLETRAASLYLRYRYAGGVDPSLKITDCKGEKVEDLGTNDFVIAEFVHRPYNFTSRNGTAVCGHKLRLLSVVRLKRRNADVPQDGRRRQQVNNARILASTPMIFN